MSHLSGKMSHLSGKIIHLSGKMTRLSGKMSHLSGKITHLSGKIIHLSGKMTHLSGKMDAKMKIHLAEPDKRFVIGFENSGTYQTLFPASCVLVRDAESICGWRECIIRKSQISTIFLER